jgi:hypothetical protein
MDTIVVQSHPKRKHASSSKNDLFKMLVLAVACIGFYFCAQEIGSLLAKTRGTLTNTSLLILIPCFVGIMLLRRMFPPVWYLVPTGALMVVVLVLKMGLITGVVIFQTLKLVDYLSWLLIRRYYPSLFSHLDNESTVSPSSESSSNLIWWLPDILVNIIELLDFEWKSKIESFEKNPVKQVLLVTAFGVAWYIEEEAMLYWFALRSNIDPEIFLAGFILYIYLNVPDMLVRAKVFKAAYLAAEGNSVKLFWEQIQATNIAIVVLLFVIAIPTSVYIHSTHIRLLMDKNACKIIPTTIHSTLTHLNNTLQERKKTVLFFFPLNVSILL